jgi:hypothetical protein
MKKFKCLRCGFEADRKYNFIKHLNRKFKCEPEINDIDIKVVMKKNNIQVNNNKKKNNFICTKCYRPFTRKDSLVRHINGRCKVIDEYGSKNKMKEVIKQKLDTLLDEMFSMKKIIEDQGKIIIDNKKNISKFKNNKINDFGEEKLDYITEKIYKKLLAYPSSSIPRLIKKIHFNPNYPENHNVRIRDKKLKFAEVRENNEWKLRHKKAVLDDLVDFGYITLEEYKDSNELDNLILQGFNKMLDNYNNSKKKIISEIELCVLNGTKSLLL